MKSGDAVSEQFLAVTSRMVAEREADAVLVSIPLERGEVREPFAPLLNQLFAREYWRHNRRVPYTERMVEGVFPQQLYAAEGYDLRALMRLERFFAFPTYAAHDNSTSFFGRMARPREGLPQTFLEYLLERWRLDKHNLSYRHFYFDVESPAWVFAELIQNPRQPKTGRTATACIMNWSFHVSKGKLQMCLLMRSLQWSHMYGDFYGGAYAMQAMLKEMKLRAGVLHLFTPKLKLDTLAQAKALLQGAAQLDWE